MEYDRMTVGLWEPVDPTNPRTDAGVAQLPRVFWPRAELWAEFLKLTDTTSSHPDLWSFLAELVTATKAKLVVESGTYRGHAVFAMAEAMATTGMEGRIWSADLVDYHVPDALLALGLGGFVTLGIGDFLAMVEQHITDPIDLAFVDASDPNNANLRIETVDFLLPRMRKGGLIVVDDCSDDAWPGAAVLRSRANLYLPLGRGTCVFQA